MAFLTRDTYTYKDNNTVILVASALVAGEDIDAASPVMVKSDGLVYMAAGTSGSTGGVVDYIGFVDKAVKAGEPLSIWKGRFHYANATLTPGKALFLTSGSAGYLQDDVLASNPAVAYALTDSDILVK